MLPNHVDPFAGLPVPRGLDPLYFDRRRSLEGALRWAGVHGDPSLCVDVGANIGQTMRAFLEWWPTSRCVSFEPLPEAFAMLRDEANRWPRRAVAHQVGVSSQPGSLTLHASRTQSTNSSFRGFNRAAETATAHRGLRGLPSHLETDGVGDDYEVSVPVVTLDGHARAASEPESTWWAAGVDLLKSDTQGWDLEVMRGAASVLHSTKVVLVEWQFDDVYGRPAPLAELDARMTDAGLRLWDVAHVYKDLATLRTLWVDLVYARAADGGR
ncbi:MAG: FkbM family methyltransferase [Acidimicrobiia bacterium]